MKRIYVLLLSIFAMMWFDATAQQLEIDFTQFRILQSSVFSLPSEGGTCIVDIEISDEYDGDYMEAENDALLTLPSGFWEFCNVFDLTSSQLTISVRSNLATTPINIALRGYDEIVASITIDPFTNEDDDPEIPAGPSLDVSDGNWIMTTTYTASAGADSIRDITYYDGLGYAAQVIQVGASITDKNIVTPIWYDKMRRNDARSYLPYVSSAHSAIKDNNPFSVQYNYYENKYGRDNAEYAYAEKVYESSPIGRVKATYNTGSSFRHSINKCTEVAYSVNTTIDSVFKLRVILPNNTLSCEGCYPAGTLQRTTTTNEDGVTTVSYNDFDNRLILSRLLIAEDEYADTYYVYDDFGRLAWVISPEGSDKLSSAISWTINSDIASKYCYRYTYDGHSRIIEKRIAGKSAEYMVYDKGGRLRLYQDGELRNVNRWLYRVYDNMGRVVDESIVEGTKSRAQLQTIYNEVSDNYLYTTLELNPLTPDDATEMTLYTTLRRYRYGDMQIAGTSSIIPTYMPFMAVPNVVELTDVDEDHDAGLLRYEYYVLADSVLHQELGGSIIGPITPIGPIAPIAADLTIQTTNIDERIERAYYYDSKGRIVQSIERDYNGGILRISYQYDFVGKILKQHEHYTLGIVDDALLRTFEYDSRGRLLAETSQLNDGSIATITYSYDDLGQLIGKTYDGDIVESFGQNIQGWRTTQSVAYNGNNLFSNTLRYYDSYLGSIPSYAGNISSWSWQHSSQPQNTYSFEYDKLSRLVDADHYVGSTLTNSFVEKNITYDKNTNLLTLKRYNNGTLTDDLSFSYLGNHRVGYNCDLNGNITNDATENLQVSYNFLNLPTAISQNSEVKARYSYAADSTKLGVVDASGVGYDYRGSFKYIRNGSSIELESVASAGGHTYKTDSGYEVRYFITDHLGSVRAVVNADGEIVEQNDYMPYGTLHANSALQNGDNRYLYGGKELQTDFGVNYYDSFARFQRNDGAFNSIDPKAENYFHISPYAYCAGNPVAQIDEDGNSPKLATTAFRLFRKAYKIYKKTGKITKASLKEAGLSGLVDIAGDVHTIFSGSTSFIDKVGAFVDLAVGTDLCSKGRSHIIEFIEGANNRHHIIPKKLFKEEPYKDLAQVFDRDSDINLTDLPEGFHGNHPQYTIWIEKELNQLDNYTEEGIAKVLHKARLELNKAYDEYLLNGKNINKYFGELNNQK